MARIIVVLGPTGAGKSVQASLIAQRCRGVHFSSGALLRNDPAVSSILLTGALVPDSEVQRVLSEAVQQTDVAKDIVLDGFPRTIEQAIWLHSYEAEWGRVLMGVVLITISEDQARERLLARGRSDDTLAAQHEKWLEYNSLTRAVIGYYRERGLLIEIDGSLSIEEVAKSIRTALV